LECGEFSPLSAGDLSPLMTERLRTGSGSPAGASRMFRGDGMPADARRRQVACGKRWQVPALQISP